MMAMAYRAIAAINALMIMGRQTKTSKPTLNLLPPLQSGSVKQLLSYPKAVIVEARDTTIGVKSACLAAVPDNPTTISSVNHPAPVVVSSTRFVLSDNEDDSSDDEADDASTTISSFLAPVASVRYCLSDSEDESASSDDDADDESKLFGEDVENDSLVYSVPDSDSIAVSDSDSIDAFLDNESSDSDLDSVVKESSVVEMVDHHSCDKLIGTIVIVDDLMEDMDWEPLPLRRSPRLAGLGESLSLRPLRRSQRLAVLYNGR